MLYILYSVQINLRVSVYRKVLAKCNFVKIEKKPAGQPVIAEKITVLPDGITALNTIHESVWSIYIVSMLRYKPEGNH